MIGKGLAAAAAFCVLAASSAFAQNVQPGTDKPATPGSASLAPPLRGPEWPHQVDKGVAGPADPIAWSPQEVEQALAHCAVLLKGLDVVTVTGPPLREGTECGTPAPMRLISVGHGQITLVPPPTLTCDMVAVLARWLERDVQPLARTHLGAPIARVETMSSYSCRNAYGRAHGRVSEHGKADAVDIGAFATARGHTALILADWGPTARQIAAEVAAAGKAHAAADEPKAPPAPGRQPSRITPVAGGLALGGQREGRKEAQSASGQQAATAAGIMPLDFKPGVAIAIPGITLDQGQGREISSGFGLMSPNRLGGPKPQPAAADAAAPEGKTDFLRAVHRSACKVFNTVLGPEANNAHLNHFHLDMAERIKNTKICE
ncbi:MAG TPA: extensin family protein [Hyphomicrobiaceae bacterium]|jgi:hypothetical protein